MSLQVRKQKAEGVRITSLIGLLSVAALSLYPVAILTVLKVFYLWIAGSFVVSILLLMYKRRVSTDITMLVKQNWPVYIFFLIPIISSSWSIKPAQTAFDGSLVVTLTALSIMLSIFYKDKCRGIDTSVFFVILVCTLITSYLTFQYGTVRPEEKWWLTNTLGSTANHLTAIVLPLIPFIFCVYLYRGKMKGSFLGLCAFFVILIGESRAGYLLGTFALLISSIYILNYNRKRIFAFTVTGFMFSVGAVFASVYFDQTVVSVLERIRSSPVFGGTVSSYRVGDGARILMYTEIVSIVQEFPLLGLGYETTSDYLESKYGISMVSHSILITYLGEMGIIGFFILVIFVLFVYRYLGKYIKLINKRDSNSGLKSYVKATQLSFFLILVHGLVRPQLTNPAMYMVIAVAVSLISMCKTRTFKWFK